MPVREQLDCKKIGLEFLLNSLNVSEEGLDFIGRLVSLSKTDKFKRFDFSYKESEKKFIFEFELSTRFSIYTCDASTISRILTKNDIDELYIKDYLNDEITPDSAFGPQHREHKGYWYKIREDKKPLNCDVLFYFF